MKILAILALSVSITAVGQVSDGITKAEPLTDAQKNQRTASGDLYFKFGSVAIHVFSLAFLKQEARAALPQITVQPLDWSSLTCALALRQAVNRPLDKLAVWADRWVPTIGMAAFALACIMALTAAVMHYQTQVGMAAISGDVNHLGGHLGRHRYRGIHDHGTECAKTARMVRRDPCDIGRQPI